MSKFTNYQLENIKLIAILDKKYDDNKISSEEYFSNRKKLMDEIYTDISDYSISTDNRNKKIIVDEILEKIND